MEATNVAGFHCQACGVSDIGDIDLYANLGYSICCNEPIVSGCALGEDGCTHDIKSVEIRNSLAPPPGCYYLYEMAAQPVTGSAWATAKDDWKLLGALIRRRRTELGLSQKAVAERLAAQLPDEPCVISGGRVGLNESGRAWNDRPYLPKAYATVLEIPEYLMRPLVPAWTRPASDLSDFGAIDPANDTGNPGVLIPRWRA